jgi:proteasome assembly chaperone (PAC2) family protein
MPNPMVAQSVLKTLTEMLNLEIDMAGIEAEAEYAQSELGKIIDYIRQQRPEFDEYINRLEQGVETEPTGHTSEELFQEIERFLRRGEDRH